MPTTMTPATTTETAPAVSAACGVGTAPPRSVRRRDGLALAATGAIPARVRALVLAQHRAELTDRARAQVRARLDAGLYPLPIPYGYRRTDTRPTSLPASVSASRADDPCTAYPVGDLPVAAELPMIDRGRHGRAPASTWHPDPDCMEAVWFMARWVQYGMTPAQIATHLNSELANTTLVTTGLAYPPLLSVSGRPRRWSARTVRGVLTDPAITGHSVWGRTRAGRPLPRSEWMISTAPTHPGLLDPATISTTLAALGAAPCVSGQSRPGSPQADSTRPGATRTRNRR